MRKTNYVDLTIAERLPAAVASLNVPASTFADCLRFAIDSHSRLTNPPKYLLNDSTEGADREFVSDMYGARLDERDARAALAKFDKQLAKLIHLRLQLADATGIPMNVTGGQPWTRIETFEV